MTEGNGGSRDGFLKERGVETFLIQQDLPDEMESSIEDIQSGELTYMYF